MGALGRLIVSIQKTLPALRSLGNAMPAGRGGITEKQIDNLVRRQQAPDLVRRLKKGVK